MTTKLNQVANEHLIEHLAELLNQGKNEVTELNVTVERNLMFEGRHGRTQHYWESYPPNNKPRFQCGCTDHVTERPEGKPLGQTVAVCWSGRMGRYRFMVNMTQDSKAPHFTIWWDKAEPSEDRPKEDHAYYWWKPDGLKVEVTGTGDHGDTDCTFGGVHFGNEVDTSRFLNGHSKTTMDLSSLKPDDVWAYKCNWGDERLEHFRPGEETDGWRLAYRETRRIAEQAATYLQFDQDVVELQAAAVEDGKLTKMVKSILVWLITVTEHFKTTELYRATGVVELRRNQ